MSDKQVTNKAVIGCALRDGVAHLYTDEAAFRELTGSSGWSFAGWVYGVVGPASVLTPAPPQTPPPDDLSAAFFVAGTMLRDAARKARDSRLQTDDDEFERVIGLFNLPPGQMFAAVRAMAGLSPEPHERTP